MEIAMNILFGLFGISLYTLISGKDYILKNKFSISKWKMPWIWSVLVLVLIAVIIGIEPKASEAIKAGTGLDVADERVSFLTMSLGIIKMTKMATEKKSKDKNLKYESN